MKTLSAKRNRIALRELETHNRNSLCSWNCIWRVEYFRSDMLVASSFGRGCLDRLWHGDVMGEEQLFDQTVLGRGQDPAEQTWETWASMQGQHWLTTGYLKAPPPREYIKSIISCSTHPLEFIFITQTDLSIDQQLLGQRIHLCSNQGKAHQLIWLHRWIGAAIMGCNCTRIPHRLISVTEEHERALRKQQDP